MDKEQKIARMESDTNDGFAKVLDIWEGDQDGFHRDAEMALLLLASAKLNRAGAALSYALMKLCLEGFRNKCEQEGKY